MTGRVIQIVPLIGALLVPVAMRAQCAPAVQQLLTDRRYEVARVQVQARHYYLGVIHQENGRRDQARAEYQAALAANPNNEDFARALASLKDK